MYNVGDKLPKEQCLHLQKCSKENLPKPGDFAVINEYGQPEYIHTVVQITDIKDNEVIILFKHYMDKGVYSFNVPMGNVGAMSLLVQAKAHSVKDLHALY